ncbi:hypothetical protein P5673_021155 [Acropora cervicornis]|uniref:Uncharacterized protein n=1 Tax=Acropora cervicornis TaxID=6130 RepID=A0AAD9V0Q4_ACRCE|nr:hypothetical protein P5673_021155 [Acropora cervicornis]
MTDSKAVLVKKLTSDKVKRKKQSALRKRNSLRQANLKKDSADLCQLRSMKKILWTNREISLSNEDDNESKRVKTESCRLR